ncbi:MAG TPA: penicillin-binding protein 2 [Chloroflexota bacterium]|nr:penicillin-binding protein 2 [Chloroflexota bacterium]
MSDPIRSLDDPLDEPGDPARRRLLGLGAFGTLGLVGLAAQLWRLQVLRGEVYRDQADNNRFRLTRTDPPRGVIHDRNGLALARNRPSYAVAVVPADLPKAPEPLFRRLGRFIDASPAEIRAIVGQGEAEDRFRPIVVRSGVDADLAHRLQERNLELPGVQIVVEPVRDFVDGQLASHVVGYVARIDAEEHERLKGDPERGYTVDDFVGKMGIELVREVDLRGQPGQKRAEVDSAGRELRVLGVDRPRPGRNIVLTIDMPLQREITRLLLGELPRAEIASAVALDPRDGQVLALVHLPSFDNNIFARDASEEELNALLSDERAPLVNGAIAAAHPPGSIFKIVTAVGALHAGVVQPDSKLECSGELLFPNRLAPGGATKFPCWTVHGQQDCPTALANSCNVFFYQLGGGDPRGEWNGLGVDRLVEWARAFGFGAPTGIELPNEAPGLIPDPAWKRRQFKEEWFKGDTFNASIGQGYVTATPIQVASLVATVANGGRVYRPQLVLRTTDEAGQAIDGFRPDLRRDLRLDPARLAVVRRGLRYGMGIGRTENGTAYIGTSWDSDLRDVAVAGKTGTAEWGVPDASGKLPTHGWFAGYGPYDQPEIALAIFLKRGRGGHDAARVARRIFAYYFGVADD